MSFVRSSTSRAWSLARCARPTRYIRAAELQPWQRALQRRTYASSHGTHEKKSELPWIATSLTGTAVGLYIVMNQDLGHGEGHDDHHDESHAKHKEPKEESEEASSDDDAKAKADNSKSEKKDDKEGAKGKAPASPDQSDKPDPSKEPKSQNEMSGKQQGLSNDDTGHSTPIHENPEKSKKGEGVAETAKVKGTVSTERPQAENKEERGKAQSDKSK